MVAKGLLAGAAGTLALDVFSYADMLLRGRPASSLPADVTQRLAQGLGIEALAAEEGDEPPNRRSGAGALLGYGVGLGAGVAYAAVRPAFRTWLPWPIAGIILGAATLVVSEGTATALGATDWAEWTPAEWVSDLVPRTLYGLCVAYVVEEFDVHAAPLGEDRVSPRLAIPKRPGLATVRCSRKWSGRTANAI